MMQLTEEEKKKQLKSNSQQQLENNELSLDEWYNSNSKQLESNRQKQLESAYVNQQLVNKYLGTQMANSGLSNTGAANLYYTNANANYRNEVGNINSAYQNSQQDLLNQYYGYKKEEQQQANADLKSQQNTLLGMYKDKVNNSLNDYGYLDEETINDLYGYFNMDELGATNASLLESYINANKGTESAINKKNQDEAYKTLYYQIADSYNNGTSDYNAFNTELANALANGSITQDQYYTLKEYNDTSNSSKQTSTQQQNFDNLYYQISDAYNNNAFNYNEYASDIWEMYQNGELNQDQYYGLKEYIDSAKSELKSFEYDDNARIFGNKVLQKLDTNGKLTEQEGTQFYSELDELYKSGKINKENYYNLRTEIQNSIETSIDLDRRTLQKDYPQVDANKFIDVDSASISSFGDWVGVGKGGTQDEWVKEILARANSNGPDKLINGDVIDFNVGLGKGNYMYYNGKFYKTSQKANITK